MEFTGKLGIYKIIETADRTKTLWSEFFNEACHNLSGAYEETLHNYILGCYLPEKIIEKNEREIHVLDVGFGLGIGLKALIDTLEKYPEEILYKKLSYSSIELDEDLFHWSIEHTFLNSNLKLVKNTENDLIKYDGTYLLCQQTPLSISIYIGDGRKTLLQASQLSLLPKFTAIFQDAFSPKKNPTLWTVEWFHFLREQSSPRVSMATYSSSISIRKSLISAGWTIINAKGFAEKRTMTKATLNGVTDAQLTAELSRSPSLELKDD